MKLKHIKNKQHTTLLNPEFKTKNCSPIINNQTNKKEYSCYTDETLLKLRDLWNRRHPDVKIQSNDSREIWLQLKTNMADICDTETCWLQQQFVEQKLANEIMAYTYAPKSPKSWVKKPTEWLNSVDIEKIMKQYEKAFTTFQFIGPSPIDFDAKEKNNQDICVWPELCNFDLQKIRIKNKKKIGFIFNTDPHYLDGSHWISLFLDISNSAPFVFFFNSTGEAAPKEIKKLCERIIEQGHKMNLDIKFMQNHPVEHQKGNTECGMYSLYLIIQLLTGQNSQDHFMNKKVRITDKEMCKLRLEYFNSAE